MNTKTKSNKMKLKEKIRQKKSSNGFKVKLFDKPCTECEGRGFIEINAGLIQRQCSRCLGLKQEIEIRDTAQGYEIKGAARSKIIRDILNV